MKSKRLLAFIAEVEARAAMDGEVSRGSLASPVAWAKRHAEELDPLRGGARGDVRDYLEGFTLVVVIDAEHDPTSIYLPAEGDVVFFVVEAVA